MHVIWVPKWRDEKQQTAEKSTQSKRAVLARTAKAQWTCEMWILCVAMHFSKVHLHVRMLKLFMLLFNFLFRCSFYLFTCLILGSWACFAGAAAILAAVPLRHSTLLSNRLECTQWCMLHALLCDWKSKWLMHPHARLCHMNECIAVRQKDEIVQRVSGEYTIFDVNLRRTESEERHAILSY